MKRRVFTMFVILACVFSVVGGHFYYKNKLEETAQEAKLELGMTAKEETKNKISSEEVQKPADHFKNAPEGLTELYHQKKNAGEALTFHLIGSTNTSANDGTWAQLFTKQMTDTYGKDVAIQVTSFGELTSLELQDSQAYTNIVDKKADIFLIEPPLLNDNDGVSMDDTLYVLAKLIAGIKSENPNTVILLQPSNPIFSPNRYADQINRLKVYAKEQNISFLNHWEKWPDVDSEVIKEYYNATTFVPNEKGHKLWADYMFNVFK
jgi:hypothetical protein